MAPGFIFAPISPLLWLFFCSSWEFHRDRVLKEEKCSIPYILYCYTLQQHIFLAFCTRQFQLTQALWHVRIHSSQKHVQNIVIQKMRLKPARPILRDSSVMNTEKSNFTTFENTKLTRIATRIFFSQWYSGEKGNLY